MLDPGAIDMLKATSKKEMWIPTFTKHDGTTVQGHYAHVNVSDDHDDAKVLGGQGSATQKEAHKNLTKHQWFNEMPDQHKVPVLLKHATELQDAAGIRARAAKFRIAILGGQKPIASQTKAFLALDADKQAKFTAEFEKAGKLDAFNEAIAAANVSPAQEAPVETTPAPAQAEGQQGAQEAASEPVVAPEPTLIQQVAPQSDELKKVKVEIAAKVEGLKGMGLDAMNELGDSLPPIAATFLYGIAAGNDDWILDGQAAWESMPSEQKAASLPLLEACIKVNAEFDVKHAEKLGADDVVKYGHAITILNGLKKQYGASAAPVKLPEGWNGSLNGLATNKDPIHGGIVDKNSDGWFVIPNSDDIDAMHGFPSQKAAFEGLAGAVAKQQAGQSAEPAAAATDDGPKEGDTKTENGVTYVLKNGRWHKVGGDQTATDAIGMPVFVGKTVAYYDKVAAKVKGLFDTGDWAGMQSLLKEDSKTWNGTSPNSKLLIQYTNDLLGAHAGQQAVEPAAPAPEAAAAEPVAPAPKEPAPDAPESIDGWVKTGGQKGSNEGGEFTDPAGQKWYCKFPASESHTKNELLAAKLYEAAGVEVPALKLISHNGKVGIASKIIDGVEKDAAALAAGAPGVADGFAVDAWLANWDVVGTGFDNMQLKPSGHAVRLDVGGSLLYRAQGTPKGEKFGEHVGELKTLMDGTNEYAAHAFGKLMPQQIAESAKKVEAVSPAEIQDLVFKYGPGSAADKASLANKLVARRWDVLKQVQGATTPPAPAAEAAPAKPKAPRVVAASAPSPSTPPADANGSAAGSSDWPSLPAFEGDKAENYAAVAQKLLEAAQAQGNLKGLHKFMTAGKKHVLYVPSEGAPGKYTQVATLRDPAKTPNGAKLLEFWKELEAKHAGSPKKKASPKVVAATVAKKGIAGAPELSAADLGIAALSSDPAGKPKKEPKPPVYVIPHAPDFANWHGPGKGLSSKAKLNEQNTQLANQIHDLAEGQKQDELNNLHYQPINAQTGDPEGPTKPISEHPSQHIKGYWADAKHAMVTPYKEFRKAAAGVLTSVGHAMMAMLAAADDVAELLQAKARIGRYAVLSKFKDNPLADWQPAELSKKNGHVSAQVLYDQSKASFAKLTNTQQKAVKDYTGPHYQTMNNPETGKGTHDKTGEAIAAIENASIPLEPGTVLSRKFTPKDMADHPLLLASEGCVLKDFGIISTSLRPEVWGGNIQLRITVGENVKGLYVAPNPGKGGGAISSHPGEDEVILPFGTKFYVKKVHKTDTPMHDQHGSWGAGHGQTIIEVVALPNM
ncbi:ADP-ribosyltransferase [Burkholderia sp. Ac-20349]|uniref:ADP-ribosyltransferase n=1 Tax=Burkholderia sp. Ac-20349 TaxID=2703893 RepID=UPI00197BFB95|nr:ADP-ribosyltransferase [Burkholderia sp. Ac-20349]MBN3839231.1 hypothetical protein [Burkholderia sp. Ac-20349]